jgi:hypothetical protein
MPSRFKFVALDKIVHRQSDESMPKMVPTKRKRVIFNEITNLCCRKAVEKALTASKASYPAKSMSKACQRLLQEEEEDRQREANRHDPRAEAYYKLKIAIVSIEWSL